MDSLKIQSQLTQDSARDLGFTQDLAHIPSTNPAQDLVRFQKFMGFQNSGTQDKIFRQDSALNMEIRFMA